MKQRTYPTTFISISAIVAMLLLTRPSHAYIEAAFALGRVALESTYIAVVQVEKVDTERNLIIYRKVQDLKGKCPTDVIKHNIAKAGFHPRESQFIMQAAQIGKIAIVFANATASETCIDNYWYQCYPGGEWWNMNHGEPYLLRTFCGKPEKLIAPLTNLLAGKEIVVPCMVDGDKNLLQLRTAKLQRMKASLALQDYDSKRDFAGWGNDEFHRINDMPGFTHQGSIGRADPGAAGIVAADFNGDGLKDLCLFGEERVTLLQNAGNSFEEVPLPYAAGARAAAWGDYNGDGKPDLLLATPTGPRLLTNAGNGKFKDDSALLPKESYYNLTAAAWIDADGDGHQDILLANGFLGLRLYRYKPPVAARPATTQPAALAAAPAVPAAFEDISDRVGLGRSGIGSNVKGHHLAIADINGDSRQDFLYNAGNGVVVINTPKGFVESKDSGISYPVGRSIPVFGDFHGDKTIDLFVPLTNGCKLYKNDGKGRFTDVTAASGDLAKFTGYATCGVFTDLSQKGRIDLIIGCLRGPNRYFRNRGDGTFVDAGDEVGFYQRIFNTRALCAFELNKDGAIDLGFANEGQESSILLTLGKTTEKPIQK